MVCTPSRLKVGYRYTNLSKFRYTYYKPNLTYANVGLLKTSKAFKGVQFFV
jgi:hypothetical protein